MRVVLKNEKGKSVFVPLNGTLKVSGFPQMFHCELNPTPMSCDNCAFANITKTEYRSSANARIEANAVACEKLQCSSFSRSDGRDVIFKEGE